MIPIQIYPALVCVIMWTFHPTPSSKAYKLTALTETGPLDSK